MSLNDYSVSFQELNFKRVVRPASRKLNGQFWSDNHTDRLNSRELKRLRLRRERRERKQLKNLNLNFNQLTSS